MSLLHQEFLNEVSADHRLLLVEQVRRWGDVNTNAVLDSKCKLFTVPHINGLIAYRIESDCAIIFGDPLCAPEDQIPLTEAFNTFCKENDLSVIFTMISQGFANLSINRFGSVLIQFGHKLVLNPQEDPFEKTGTHAGLVRRKVRRAINEGIIIHEYTDENLEIENTMQAIGKKWLSGRSGPQIYIARLNLFNDREGKRWFYATKDNQIVGLLVLNRIEAHSSWLLNNLIITDDVPPGVSELLITNVLDILRIEGCERVIVGPVTADTIENINGLNSVSAFFVRAFFNTTKLFFRLDKQTMFWDKFDPKMEPSYLMFDKVNLRTVRALLRAMNVKV